MQNLMSMLFSFGLVSLTSRPVMAAEQAMTGHGDLANFLFSVLAFAGLVQGIFYLLHLKRKQN